jgi:hypothetical protein
MFLTLPAGREGTRTGVDFALLSAGWDGAANRGSRDIGERVWASGKSCSGGGDFISLGEGVSEARVGQKKGSTGPEVVALMTGEESSLASYPTGH